MKLIKTICFKKIREAFILSGYKEVNDSLTGADGLFIKLLDNNFFLTLGIELSNLYDKKFSASFYLSKTTRWGAVWGDIPYEAYERPGKFLTKEERKLYLDEEHNQDGVVDVWWVMDREGDCEKFIQAVSITEKRFLEQKNLFSKIEKSMDIKKMESYLNEVFEIIDKGVNESFEYQFLPKREVDNIPVEWFKAAERALVINNGILNINTVKKLAGDAWRQSLVRKLSW